MARAIALDYGDVRTGVAISDFHGILASPHGALATASASFWEEVGALIAEFEPVYIAVGLPTHLSGSAGARVQIVQEFIKELETRFNLPVLAVDERLSSRLASAQFRSAGHKAKRSSGDLDAQAAVLILEQAMSMQK